METTISAVPARIDTANVSAAVPSLPCTWTDMLLSFRADPTSMFSCLDEENLIQMIGIHCGYIFATPKDRDDYNQFLDDVRVGRLWDPNFTPTVNQQTISYVGPAELLANGLLTQFSRPYCLGIKSLLLSPTSGQSLMTTRYEHVRLSLFRLMDLKHKALLKATSAAIDVGGITKYLADLVLRSSNLKKAKPEAELALLRRMLLSDENLLDKGTLHALFLALQGQMDDPATCSPASLVTYVRLATLANTQPDVDERTLRAIFCFLLEKYARLGTRDAMCFGGVLCCLESLLLRRPESVQTILSNFGANTDFYNACVNSHEEKFSNLMRAVARAVPTFFHIANAHFFSYVAANPSRLLAIGTYDEIFQFIRQSGRSNEFLYTGMAERLYHKQRDDRVVVARHIVRLFLDECDDSSISPWFLSKLCATLDSDDGSEKRSFLVCVMAKRIDTLTTLLTSNTSHMEGVDTSEIERAKRKFDAAFKDAVM